MDDPVSDPLRLLIADGHPVSARGVRTLLQDFDRSATIDEAESGADAIRMALAMRVDIAIIDMATTGMHGIGTLRQIVETAPNTAVIVFSAHEDVDFARDSIEAGARGYVLKRSPGHRLIQAVEAVRRGGLYIDPAIAARLVPIRKTPGARPPPGARGVAAGLTDREREVFKSIALGFTNKEVAGQLGVTAKSVETYKTRASEKLNIHSRAKIVQYAIQQGWFSAPPP